MQMICYYLFHEIIDPYEPSFTKGKEDGKKAALQQGYNDDVGGLKAEQISQAAVIFYKEGSAVYTEESLVLHQRLW